jgi:hypothetical protein
MGHMGAPGAHVHPIRLPKHRPSGAPEGFMGQIGGPTLPIGSTHAKIGVPDPQNGPSFLKISYVEMSHICAPGAHVHPIMLPKHRPRGTREGFKGQIGGPTIPIGSTHAKIGVPDPQNGPFF